MIGYIYSITNLTNGKIYIGQTVMSLKQRWNRHLSMSRQPNPTGIAGAIAKYGSGNFIMELVCEAYSDKELNELEKFYIHKYDSFHNGYNLTLGGDGALRLELKDEDVIQKYKEFGFITDTAKYFQCSVVTISNILHRNNIEIIKTKKPGAGGIGVRFKEGDGIKPVKIIETGQIFSSLKECSQWLIDNGYSQANSMEMARKSLSRCLNGERKTYCKLHFEFV